MKFGGEVKKFAKKSFNFCSASEDPALRKFSIFALQVKKFFGTIRHDPLSNLENDRITSIRWNSAYGHSITDAFYLPLHLNLHQSQTTGQMVILQGFASLG